MENLRHLLRGKDPNHPVYYGCIFDSTDFQVKFIRTPSYSINIIIHFFLVTKTYNFILAKKNQWQFETYIGLTFILFYRVEKKSL